MRRSTMASLAAIAALAFAVRLLIGLQVPLDGDEALAGVAALRILRGQPILMETAARYLGSLDSWILEPFVAAAGPTLVAIRLGTATVGAAYAVCLFALGRVVFARDRPALGLAALGTVFPLFAVEFGVKARSYDTLLPLEASLLALGLATAFSFRPVGAGRWAALGFVSGVALWHHPLLALPVGAVVLAIASRWRRLRPRLRDLGSALIGAAVGYGPWIVFNLQTGLSSLRHLYSPLRAYSVSFPTAVRDVLAEALPISVGTRANLCGGEVAPAAATDLALVALAVLVLWRRRHVVAGLARRDLSVIEPVDFVLLVAPLSLLAVTAHFFNALSCEPRYLTPLTVPLLMAVILALSEGPRAARAATAAGLALLLAAGVVTLARTLPEAGVSPQTHTRLDLPAEAAALERRRPQAVWAFYYLAQSLRYFSGERLTVGEYGGYVGFADDQAAALRAPHATWVFARGDPEISAFEDACRRRGVGFTRVDLDGALLAYADLSGPITPEDLGIPTQTVESAR